MKDPNNALRLSGMLGDRGINELRNHQLNWIVIVTVPLNQAEYRFPVDRENLETLYWEDLILWQLWTRAYKNTEARQGIIVFPPFP